MNGHDDARKDAKNDAKGGVADPDLAARLNTLSQTLADRRTDTVEKDNPSNSGSGAGFAQAMKVSSDFIAGILVGGAIGWGLDYGLGTSPFGLIVFVLLGFAAGVLNALRSARLVTDPFAEFPGGQEADPDKSEDKTGH